MSVSHPASSAADRSPGRAPRRVLALCGSLRRGSFNRGLLDAATELAPVGMTVERWPTIGDLPIYDADLDPSYAPRVEAPAAVVRLREAAHAADAFLIATPEYNYSIPGGLKNALDWLSRPLAEQPFRGRPVALMGATGGMSGTMRAQYHLRQCFVFLDAPLVQQPEVLCAVAAQKFDADARLTDETTRGLVARLLVALDRLCDRYPRA